MRKKKPEEALTAFLRAPESRREREKEEALAAYEYLVFQTIHKQFGKLPYGICKEDLAQDGRLGLNTALENYDPSKNTAFETWAIRCIYTSMIKRIKAECNSLSGLKYERSITKAINSFVIAIGREPSDDELAIWMDITPEKLGEMKYTVNHNHPCYLSQPLTSEDGSNNVISYAEVLPSNVDIHDELVTKQHVEVILGLIDKLPYEMRAIAYMMLEKHTINDIAKAQKLSPRRVGAIMYSIRRKLKTALRKAGYGELFEGRRHHKEVRSDKSADLRKAPKVVKNTPPKKQIKVCVAKQLRLMEVPPCLPKKS